MLGLNLLRFFSVLNGRAIATSQKKLKAVVPDLVVDKEDITKVRVKKDIPRYGLRRILPRYGRQGGYDHGTGCFKEDISKVWVVSRRKLPRYGFFQGEYYQGTGCFKEDITKVRVASRRILPGYRLLQEGYYQGTGTGSF